MIDNLGDPRMKFPCGAWIGNEGWCASTASTRPTGLRFI
jgi:hypothetical protein